MNQFVSTMHVVVRPGISVSEFGAKYGWTVAGDLKERINLDIGLS